MSLILNIDTSSELASLSLARNGETLHTATNADQKGHAAWIHKAIAAIFESQKLPIKSLDAVALTTGPGSYTGLRVGMATAKGLCYALNKPLIEVNTLFAMAWAMLHESTDYLCPMMDAGRMEVYTALYTKDLQEVVAPAPMILDECSFSEVLSQKTVSFFGSGRNKFSAIQHSKNAFFRDSQFHSADMGHLTHRKFIQSEFASLAYLEPFYLKEYSTRNN